MRWKDLQGSNNVEDRRGQGGGFGGFGQGAGFGRGFPGLGGGLGRSGGSRPAGGMLRVGGGKGLLILAVVMIAGYYGIDLSPLLTGEVDLGGMVSRMEAPEQPRQAPGSQAGSSRGDAQNDELAQFTRVALRLTEDNWTQIFKANGMQYRPPVMVLYQGVTPTACGTGQSAMGPFYCPGDHKLYIDLSFYRDMKTRLGGGGEFALGYVLAHEVGHHVQTLLGYNKQVNEAMQRSSKTEANKLSVRQELHADCLAGIWGGYVKKQGRLDEGDFEKAMNTATAIGDDRLQKMSTGRVVPDSFTHGTSEQRKRWFKLGFDSGSVNKCNAAFQVSEKKL
ncbi:MAG: neutral zinc metallopeptidase [Duodenibacillus sp.]|nr:neutral zinc metallopeptidase [Duodenibacillus sp.]